MYLIDNSMIKDFYKISEKDLDYLLTHKFTVWEKLDMFYFRVEITKIGAIPLRGSTGKVISDIDCVTNSLYKGVCDFVNKKVNPIRNKIIEEYGEGTVGFFYLPKQTYHKITYSNLPEKTVFLSDWYFPKHQDILDITCSPGSYHIHHLAHILGVEQPPLMAIWRPEDRAIEMKSLKDKINNYLENKTEDRAKALVNKLIQENLSNGSRNQIFNIEGIIIRTDKFQYQIRLKDTEDNLDKSVKLIYRDTLLKSVADYYSKNINALTEVFNSCESYIDRVSKLFLSYIEKTDLFTKFSFDPEDLLPPTTAYFGDIDYEMISDTNVKLICKYNEVNKNIFRLFLHTFAQKISEDKFNSLPNSVKDILNDLIIKLKYKNYKEILLTAYKANS